MRKFRQKNEHTTTGYSDHILEQLELGEISGKFKEEWRRKLSDFDEHSTYFFTGGSNKLYMEKKHFSAGGFCVSSKKTRATHTQFYTQRAIQLFRKKEIKICSLERSISALVLEMSRV
jgi:hypothetical protein